MKISFIGDISLNDNYIELYKNGIDPFKVIEPVLASSDIVIGNLECLANGNKGENELKKPRLRTTVETLNYLNNINLKVACLAHNHVYDHLIDGFQKTINFLNQNGILHLGAGLSATEAKKYQILQKDGLSIVLLNYVTYDTNPNLPVDSAIYLNMFDIDQCKNEIQLLSSKVNYIVLSLHWGGKVEGGFFPDWDQPKIAHELIDAGADLIIGHHSHTIQPFEIYKGKYIFYSLGNFCFSDLTFEGEMQLLTNRRKITIILIISFYKDYYSVKIRFFRNNLNNYSPANQYIYSLWLRNKIFKLTKISVIWRIYFFFHKKVNPVILFFFRRDLTLFEKIKRLNSSKFRKHIAK